MKILKVTILALFAAVMLYASSALPDRGDPDNQMHAERSLTNTPVIGNYAIQEPYNDARTPNFVTVILGDYRGIDTFGEQTVIFTAGFITILILRRRRER